MYLHYLKWFQQCSNQRKTKVHSRSLPEVGCHWPVGHLLCRYSFLPSPNHGKETQEAEAARNTPMRCQLPFGAHVKAYSCSVLDTDTGWRLLSVLCVNFIGISARFLKAYGYKQLGVDWTGNKCDCDVSARALWCWMAWRSWPTKHPGKWQSYVFCSKWHNYIISYISCQRQLQLLRYFCLVK